MKPAAHYVELKLSLYMIDKFKDVWAKVFTDRIVIGEKYATMTFGPFTCTYEELENFIDFFNELKVVSYRITSENP